MSRYLLLFSVLFLVLPAMRAEAEGCTAEPFLGHSMSDDAVVEAPPLEVLPAFPNLSFSNPVFLTAAGDGSDRLFVLEQFTGVIRVFANDPDANAAEVYLDLAGAPTGALRTGSESGLLGVAFDPDFDDPSSDDYGAFYVYYSVVASDCACDTSGCHHCSKVVRFTAASHTDAQVEASTAELVLEVEQPFGNHNGGMLAFGPHDDMLYVSLGDGGSGDDPNCNGQDPNTLHGTILRVDPRSEAGYGIPTDNPVPAGLFDGRPEVWHYGLRNPWRFSFDRIAPHDMWIGDVGQGAWEEIDYAPEGVGGQNFGWNLREGKHDFARPGSCGGDPGVDPVLEYANPSTSTAAVTGGYVYRGTAIPSLYGSYVYADYSTGTVWAWDRVTTDPANGLGLPRLLVDTGPVSAFGEDEAGELYLVGYDGSIGRLSVIEQPQSQFPPLLSDTGFFADTETLTPAAGMRSYEVTSQLWSDRAAKQRWLALPEGEKIGFHSIGAWDYPLGTAFVKHFELPAPGGTIRRLETRVLLLQTTGWIGLTYRWNDSQTDAVLLTSGLVEAVDVEFDGVPQQQLWSYPSPSGCLGCHTEVGGWTLGPRARQLNAGSGVVDNGLERWNCLGLFDTDLGPVSQFGSFAAIDDLAASDQRRVRSHLASNCSFCHAPGGPGLGGIDLRYDALLGDMAIIGEPPSQGDLGLMDPERVKPGFHAESVLWHRLQSNDPLLRMAVGTRIAQEEAVSVVADWIDLDLAMPDTDEDGVPDTIDNCPVISNAGQGNVDQDGLGDACDPDQAPDLTVVSNNPSLVFLGSHIPLEASVSNGGEGDSVSSQVRFYLSADQEFDPGGDVAIGDCFAPALIVAQTATCVDPDGWIPGDLAVLGEGETAEFYWIACSDALDLIFEREEFNNCSVDPEPVLVPEPASWVLEAAALLTLFGVTARRRRFSAQ